MNEHEFCVRCGDLFFVEVRHVLGLCSGCRKSDEVQFLQETAEILKPEHPGD